MLCLLTSALAYAQTPRVLTGTVVKVIDGNTIHVRLGNRIEKLRYIGMNARELHHPTKGVEPLGHEATEANRKLVQGQTVRLEVDVQERDRYGRLLAYVYVGDTMVNAELVAQGYAQVMTVPPNVKHQDDFFAPPQGARFGRRPHAPRPLCQRRRQRSVFGPTTPKVHASGSTVPTLKSNHLLSDEP